MKETDTFLGFYFSCFAYFCAFCCSSICLLTFYLRINLFSYCVQRCENLFVFNFTASHAVMVDEPAIKEPDVRMLKIVNNAASDAVASSGATGTISTVEPGIPEPDLLAGSSSSPPSMSSPFISSMDDTSEVEKG
jgi:hypothetical protein